MVIARQRTRRNSRLVAVVAVLALALVACGGDGDNGDDGTTAPPPDAPDNGEGAENGDGNGDTTEPVEPLEMAVPGSGLGVFWTLPWFVAQEEGFFEKHGADITVRALGPGIDGARAVQTGEVDFGSWTTGGLVGMAANVDPSLRILAGMDRDTWLVASSDPDVTECEDLGGLQDIAVDAVGGARYIVLESILASCGLSTSDVSTVDFGATVILESMSAGTITTSVLHINEVVQIEQLTGEELNIIAWYRDVVDDLHFIVHYVQEDTLDAHREHFVRYMAGYIEAMRWIVDQVDLDRAAEIAAEFTAVVDENTAREAIVTFIDEGIFVKDDPGLSETGINAELQNRINVGDVEEADALWAEDLVVAEIWEEAMARVDG